MKRINDHKYLRMPQNKAAVNFYFNGKPVSGYEGDTIISALYASGKRIFTRSFKYHRPRGFYDYYGYGAELLMTVDGKPNILAGLTAIKSGMKVKSQNAWPSLEFDIMAINQTVVPMLPTGFYYKMFHKPKAAWPIFEKAIRKAAGLGKVNTKDNHHSIRSEKQYYFPDVCVIGGGIAGLSAAKAALEKGKRVLLIETHPQLGGRALHRAYTVHDCLNKDLNGKKEWEAVKILIDELNQHPALQIFTETFALGIYEDNLVAALQGDDLLKIRAETVIVAGGATDRHIGFQNNDMPGIVQGAAIEKLIALHGIKPGKRATVFTCHDGGYHTAVMLKNAGVDVFAVFDSRESISKGEFFEIAQQENIDVQTGKTIHAATGKTSVESVKFGSIDGKDTMGNVYCDLAVVCFGYKSTMQLLTMGRENPIWDEERGIFRQNKPPKYVYAAGDINGFGYFHTLYEEGQKAGHAAANLTECPESQRSSEELITLLPADIESPGDYHFIDKCMDVTHKEIIASVKEGYNQVELLKRYTSMGMGPGQGKSSYEAIARVSAKECGVTEQRCVPTTVRPPFVPVSLAALAGRSHHLVPTRRSPIHHWHEKNGATFLIAGQWKRPEVYTTVNEEVLNVRKNIGIVDVSTLGKIELRGSDVVNFLQFFMPGKYAKLAVGKTRYAAMTTEAGILYEDGTLSRLDENSYYISTTTGNQDAIYSQFSLWRDIKDFDIEIRNLSSTLAAINITGPKCREFLSKYIEYDISADSFSYMSCARTKICGIDVNIFRIGFTGELGYEIHYPAEYGQSLWEYLLEEGSSLGLQPFGIESQRVLRLEKGHLIPGTDTDALSSPYDAGVDFVIKEDKEDFIGKQFLNNFKSKDFSLREKLITYKLDSSSPIPEDGVAVLNNNKIAGRVTSSRYSPTLGYGIGMAWIDTSLAKPGSSFLIRDAKGNNIQAEVLHHAPYDPDGKKLKL